MHRRIEVIFGETVGEMPWEIAEGMYIENFVGIARGVSEKKSEQILEKNNWRNAYKKIWRNYYIYRQ